MPVFTTRPVIRARKGVVTSGHYLATAAGWRIMEQGGNAVDAAAAMGLCLALLEPENNGLGGEVPTLIYSAKEGKAYAVSGMGWSPEALTIDWCRAHGVDNGRKRIEGGDRHHPVGHRTTRREGRRGKEDRHIDDVDEAGHRLLPAGAQRDPGRKAAESDGEREQRRQGDEPRKRSKGQGYAECSTDDKHDHRLQDQPARVGGRAPGLERAPRRRGRQHALENAGLKIPDQTDAGLGSPEQRRHGGDAGQ